MNLWHSTAQITLLLLPFVFRVENLCRLFTRLSNESGSPTSAQSLRHGAEIAASSVARVRLLHPVNLVDPV